jgi:ribosome-binding factor A
MSHLIRAELARVLIEEISDPSLADVTFTEVELTADLRHARVFFMSSDLNPTPQKEKEKTRGFHRAMPFFRRRIADNLDLRYVPDLDFVRDTHGESVNRLLHLMDEVDGPNRK